MEQVIEREAERAVKKIGTALSGDAPREVSRSLEDLQRGIASKYGDESSLRILLKRLKESLAPNNESEFRMVRDFLEDCIAWKVAAASRGRNR